MTCKWLSSDWLTALSVTVIQIQLTENGRETERETERQSERDRDRERERDTERERERTRERHWLLGVPGCLRRPEVEVINFFQVYDFIRIPGGQVGCS